MIARALLAPVVWALPAMAAAERVFVTTQNGKEVTVVDLRSRRGVALCPPAIPAGGGPLRIAVHLKGN